MKKRKTGRIVFGIIVLLLALAIGGYFAATRLFGMELPLLRSYEEAAVGWVAERVFGMLGQNEATAYVQSVATILGVGYTGHSNRYSGVVEAKEVIEINPDSQLTILERYVSAGDTVYAGMPLFAYDVESLTLSYEQLLIDITGLENSIRTAGEEIESLNKRLEKAKENKKYELNLQLQEVSLSLKKAEYDLKSKRTQAENLERILADSVVKSPVAGRVRSVRSDDASNPFGYGQESSNAYITIVAGTDYCVKGKVNEQTVRTLFVGMPVTIRSRTDESAIWRGEIYKINTDEPVSEQGGYYYDGGGGDRSSKYAFYVSIDAIDGLIMGQHVYIELGEPGEDDGKMWLPSYYLMQENGAFSVYAANGKSRIERRAVRVGAYNAETDSYEIVSGLGYTDRIAFPDESVFEGMLASETRYAGEDGPALPLSPDPFGANDDTAYSFDAPEGMDGEYGVYDDKEWIMPEDGTLPEELVFGGDEPFGEPDAPVEPTEAEDGGAE